MAHLLPLFPLQLVAFPGRAMPLHIFEERYREMVGEALEDGSPFGIVLSKEGGVVDAGCAVHVEHATKYPDGRFDIVARGRRRFSLRAINQDRSYLRGEVEFFDDDDLTPASKSLREQAIAAHGEVCVARGVAPEERPDPASPFFSFRIAEEIDDLDFQNLLLRSRSETARLQQFIEFSRTYVPRAVYTEKMKHAAPRNGFGHKPAEL